MPFSVDFFRQLATLSVLHEFRTNHLSATGNKEDFSLGAAKDRDLPNVRPPRKG